MQFGGDPFFAPRDIHLRHGRDQALHLDQERRPTARV
jgi:hypothetical protein